MNTLQQIATFTGQQPVSMHTVGELIPSFTALERTSMQAMIPRTAETACYYARGRGCGRSLRECAVYPDLSHRAEPRSGA